MPALELAGGELLVQGGLLLAKATLVMVGALVMSRTLLRKDPEARHALWTGTMVTLLLLPVLSVGGVPGLAVPVPVLSAPAVAGSGEVTPTSPLLRGLPRADEGSVAREVIPGSETSWATHPFPLRDGSGGTDRAAHLPTPVHPEALPLDGSRATPTQPSGGMGERVAAGMGLFWGLGTLLFLVVLLTGLLRARRLIRQARPLETPDWQDQARSAARRVGFRRAFSLRMARRARSAMAGGLVRPVVLLPTEARSWSLDRRDVVLLHELVHVKRHDPLRQLLDRLVVALYWFHPLARLVAREAATAREEACDRRVVELGARPSKYATHLVELVDRRIPASAGLTGFHHPDLEKRIMSILAPSHRSSRGPALASGLLALAWFGVVATATPVASQAPPDPPTPPVLMEVPAPPIPPFEFSLPETVPPPIAPTATPLPEPDPPSTPVPPPARSSIDTLGIWGCGTPRVESEGNPGFLLRDEVDGESTMLRITGLGEYGVCLRSLGTVQMTEAGVRPESMAPGSAVQLMVSSTEGSQRLRIEADDDGTLHEHWFVNGDTLPVTPQVEAWRDALEAYLGATSERSRILGREARLRGEVARMTGERARLRGEVARAEGELARLLGERSRIVGDTARRSEMDEEIGRLRESTTRQVEAFDSRIEALEAEHATRTREIEAEIASLETEARVDEIDARLDELRARALEAIESIGFDGGSR